MPRPLSPLRYTLLGLLLVPHAHAQSGKRTWKIPAGGAAMYTADETFDWRLVNAPKRRPAPPVTSAPHGTFLFESELDDKQQHVRRPPTDIRWVAPTAAFDLRANKRGKVRMPMPWVAPFGRVDLVGTISRPETDGTEILELAVHIQAPDQGGMDDHGFKHLTQLRRFEDCKGKLVIRRRFDQARGAVTWFESTLELQCTDHRKQWLYTMRLQQTWTLESMRKNRGAGFPQRVNTAIRKSTAWILKELEDTKAPTDLRETSQSNGPGAWALATLALLHAEVDPNHPEVQKRVEQVRNSQLTETYTLSLAILMMEKLYAPAGERNALLSGQIDRPTRRKLPKTDLRLIQKWTDRLLDNRDRNVGTSYLSRWSYTGNSYDNSNTQFALLALHSAELCGAKISPTVWHGAAKHWLQEQCNPEGRPLRLPLVAHEESKTLGAPTLVRRTASRSVSRGFSYHGTASLPYGNMTSAGVTGLTLCIANLERGRRRVAERHEINQALRDGFSWLYRHRTVRAVAGPCAAHSDYWYYYGLYSLERACELSRVAWIGDWDWYYEGSELLLSGQQDDGQFLNITLADNCFALLFLKQAQLPVLTGPRDRK